MQAKPALPLNPSQHTLTAPFRGTPLPLCSSGRLRYSISFGNLIAAPTRRVTAPSLMWIPSNNNIAEVGFACVKPFNPIRLQRYGHCGASHWAKLAQLRLVAAGWTIILLRCQYASIRQNPLP